MIDYVLLGLSAAYYEDEGFQRIESPWLVSEAVNRITAPIGASMYYVQKQGKTKCFVASGEQSFLYLINKNFIPGGNYQTITPCMRDEDFDSTHTKYFMKNELISFGRGRYNAEDMTAIALSFFAKTVGNARDLEVVKTDEGFDINFHGIEIGSYGERSCEFVDWTYGTGLAEPRFSRILNRKRELWDITKEKSNEVSMEPLVKSPKNTKKR